MSTPPSQQENNSRAISNASYSDYQKQEGSLNGPKASRSKIVTNAAVTRYLQKMSDTTLDLDAIHENPGKPVKIPHMLRSNGSGTPQPNLREKKANGFPITMKPPLTSPPAPRDLKENKSNTKSSMEIRQHKQTRRKYTTTPERPPWDISPNGTELSREAVVGESETTAENIKQSSNITFDHTEEKTETRQSVTLKNDEQGHMKEKKFREAHLDEWEADSALRYSIPPPPPPPPPPKLGQLSKEKKDDITPIRSLEQAHERMKASKSSPKRQTGKIAYVGELDSRITYGFRSLFELSDVSLDGYSGTFTLEMHACQSLDVNGKMTVTSSPENIEQPPDNSWVPLSMYQGDTPTVPRDFYFGPGTFCEIKPELVYLNPLLNAGVVHIYIFKVFEVSMKCKLGLRSFPFDRHIIGMRVLCKSDVVQLDPWQNKTDQTSRANFRPPVGLDDMAFSNSPSQGHITVISSREAIGLNGDCWWELVGVQRVMRETKLYGDQIEIDICIQRNPVSTMWRYAFPSFVTVAASSVVLSVPPGDIESRLILLILLFLVLTTVRATYSMSTVASSCNCFTRLDWYFVVSQLLLLASVVECVIATVCSKDFSPNASHFFRECTFDVIYHIAVLSLWSSLHLALTAAGYFFPHLQRPQWLAGPGSS